MTSSSLVIPRVQTPWDAAWQAEFVGTLMFVVSDKQVLLIHKKTGHGAGRVNAPGGKLHAGESALDCAIRETREEVGLTVPASACHCACEMRFVEQAGPQWLGFAFVARQWSGTPVETREARPFWCDLSTIPYDRMWPDDAQWLPRVLASDGTGAPFVGSFLFREEALLEHVFEASASIVNFWS